MIAVTASSFLKNKSLCEALVQSFPNEDIKLIPGADSLQEEALANVLTGARGWLVGREICSKGLVQKLVPSLQVISKYGVGLDNIDQLACEELGVEVCYEPGVNREAVAEHTVGLMLSMMRGISRNSGLLKQGIWHKNGGVNLTGKKIGIVGLGFVGLRVAELLQAFHCELAYADIVDKTSAAAHLKISRLAYSDILAWADVISFHVPLTNHTRAMFDFACLKMTKAGVYLVNTARGPVVDHNALKEGLLSGQLAGAALDVFEVEPLDDKSLYTMENLVLTPHTAGNSQEAVMAMGLAAIRGLKKQLAEISVSTDLFGK